MTDLNNEKDVVAQILQSRRDLVANVSHELRTPVATLRAAIESLLDRWEQSPPEENRRKVALMETEIKQLSGLIDDLFTLSQAELSHLPLYCEKLDVTVLIRQVEETFAPLAWKSGRVQVTSKISAEIPAVFADARRIQQVLLNLLRNAVRYTPPGGIVVLLAESEEERVRILVQDTGEGIDPADLPHIWERFYRGPNSTFENAGLGLALVKELTEAMGGSVAVESTPGQGSCFTLNVRRA